MKMVPKSESPQVEGPTPRVRSSMYLALLERRIASSLQHLADVSDLAEECDLALAEAPSQGDTGSTLDEVSHSSHGEDLVDVRALLSVDKTELEQDLARLRRQKAMLR
jgi:hypothetical protein